MNYRIVRISVAGTEAVASNALVFAMHLLHTDGVTHATFAGVFTITPYGYVVFGTFFRAKCIGSIVAGVSSVRMQTTAHPSIVCAMPIVAQNVVHARLAFQQLLRIYHI